VALSCAALAVLASSVAGCGESTTQKQTDQYAQGLCTSISTWTRQINAIAASLTNGTPQHVARTKLVRARTATIQLVTDVQALQVPDVSGAQEARQHVDRLVADSQATIITLQVAKKQIDSYGTGARNIATVALPVALQLANLVSEGKSTVTALKVVKGPFEKAVKKSEACKAIESAQAT